MKAKTRTDVVVVFCLAVVLATLPARAGTAPATASEEVGRAVRDYLGAIDAGDLDRQMTFWSTREDATSVIMGEIWTGIASIRACSAEYVPVSKVLRNELGQVNVVELGPDLALAIAPYRSVRRNPADEKLKPFELDSMLTLLWTRAPDGWRIIHEHVSVKVPPPVSN